MSIPRTVNCFLNYQLYILVCIYVAASLRDTKKTTFNRIHFFRSNAILISENGMIYFQSSPRMSGPAQFVLEMSTGIFLYGLYSFTYHWEDFVFICCCILKKPSNLAAGPVHQSRQFEAKQMSGTESTMSPTW